MTENKTLTASLVPIVAELIGRWEYLDDLTNLVAARTGNDPIDREFAYSVYCANKIAEEEALRARMRSLRMLPATSELMAFLSGKRVEAIRGIGSLAGEKILSGKIVPDGRGGHLFLPGKNRTRGFYPRYIREAS